jgi:Ca2+-binding RTX toxin-like protein
MPIIYGTDNSETINADDGVTDGNDVIFGYGGTDIILGLGGDDEIIGGEGPNDWINGGPGNDTVSYGESASGVTVSLATGSGFGGTAEGDDIFQVENVTGSWHGDLLVGDDGNNVLRGLGGNDILKGGGGADALHGDFGNDSLKGGGGDDTLNGGTGADTMLGGTGSDTYYVDNVGDVVTEAAGQGANDRVRTSTSYSLAPSSEVEILETTDPNAATAINLVGNEYGNTIVGNAGNNVIAGGAGLDSLVGGDSADLFVWNSITEMGTTLDANSDTVGSDFNPLIGDLIALNPIDADSNAGNGDTAFTFIGDASNPFTAAGQVSWLIGGADTYILLNTDGDASADGVIRVLGAHTVDASWFAL